MKRLLMTVIISCLTTAVSEAATYYVAKTGSNANSCATAQTHTSGKLTVTAGASCLVAGDTLYIKAGTYSETHQSIQLPAATSWAGATTISNYQSDIVTFRGAGYQFNLSGGTARYVIFNGLIFDGQDNGVDYGFPIGQGVHHIRMQNFELKNFSAYITSSADGIELKNCSVHDVGMEGTINPHGRHGIYLSGTNGLVEYCHIYNIGWYGIHVFGNSGTASNNTIRNNIVHNTSAWNGAFGAGIIISRGTDNVAYNNVVYSNNTGILLGSDSGASSTLSNKAYNNTVFSNTNAGINISPGCTSCVVVNNVVWLNGSTIYNAGTSTTQSNNLTTDPKFVNPSIKNFHLQTGSAAIDAGTDLLSKRLTVDFAGRARPQGCCLDIGAYEYGSQAPGPGPTAPSNLIASPLTSP